VTRLATKYEGPEETRVLERLIEELDQLGALRFDAKGYVVSCNATLGRLLGCSASGLRGAPLDAVLVASDAAAVRALLRDGRPYVTGRVHLAFRRVSRPPLTLECAIALEGGGGALLGGPLCVDPGRGGR
jgi:PAS domain-containing protein